MRGTVRGLAAAVLLIATSSCRPPPATSYGGRDAGDGNHAGNDAGNDARSDGARDGATLDSPVGDAPDSGPGPGPPPAWQWTVACPDGHDPTDPIDYGRCALDQALAEVGGQTTPIVIATFDSPLVAPLTELGDVLDPRPESYAVLVADATTWIVGRDDVGAMYGALELAERVRLSGRAAAAVPTSVLRGSPAVEFRAANLFWNLPENSESAWWYLDESFWRAYLDLMAYARLDFLDFHGVYDSSSTAFPNALLHLARSPSFPDVGVPVADRARNMQMLNRVIVLARARGIRVGLMTYSASSRLDGLSAETLSADQHKTYIREAARDLATQAPGLALLGFRIGESGKAASWYVDTFVAGVKEAGMDTSIYARTWLSSKPEISALASAVGAGMLLEAKYNGEHLGPPYAIAGGAMAKWTSYSYQTYLNPPAPWRFVFQVRTAGTHRIFRHASFDRTRRAVLSLGMSPEVKGFSLEPPHAFLPQREFQHAQLVDQLSPWTFVRDDMMYLLWGRLGYDPETPEATFRAIAAREAGNDDLWVPLQAASDIVPWIQTARTCGPDHRNFAPELELGGDVAQWAEIAAGPVSVPSCAGAGPFDTFAVASAAEAAADLLAGRATSKLGPVEVAALLLDDAERSDRAVVAADPDAPAVGPLARDLARECRAVSSLGRYFAHKLRGATALAVFARSGAEAWLGVARREVDDAAAAWRTLAADTAYIPPFSERLRMQPLGYEPFHWKAEVPALDADRTAIDAVVAAVAAKPPVFAGALPDPEIWLTSPRRPGPRLEELSVTPEIATASEWTVRARFDAMPAGATAQVLWKPFDSETDWIPVPAAMAADGSFAAVINGGGAGALFAVELRTPTSAWRYPDPLLGMPYVPLAP